MKRIAFYSQHVLGAGHFFRSLEIASALAPVEVHMICGGTGVHAALPDNVVYHGLPELMMDSGFSTLLADRPVEEIQAERKEMLMDVLRELGPDLFLVELFPFGRKRFGFELLPALEAIRTGGLKPCPVVCSVRDILVEKSDQAKYETRVLKHLALFDAVLVHADPALAELGETFSRVEDIPVEVRYTGYVTPRPTPGRGGEIRGGLGLGEGEPLILCSAGGGNVGGPLLRGALEGSIRLAESVGHRMLMFTGPFLEDREYEGLRDRASSFGHIRIERFSNEFLDHLDAADLSVSMAGYNTTMNLLSTGVFGLVLPFAQNREQGMRARRLEQMGALKVLEESDLTPERMAGHMAEGLTRGKTEGHGLNLDGGAGTARALADIHAEWKEKRHGQV